MMRVFGVFLMVLVGMSGMKSADAAKMVGQITVDANGVVRKDSPVSATVEMDLPDQPLILLPTGAYSGRSIPLQIERSGKSITLYWVEPDLKADQKKTYGIFTDDNQKPPVFHFNTGADTRDLVFDQTPIWRDMNKYDPADRADTFKPYTHVFAFGDPKDFITKGPGGLYTHHRGIFFGFKAFHGKTLLGDFWHCPNVTQQHVKYLDDRTLLGEVVARDASVTDWVATDNKPVVEDTREVTTWRVSPTDMVMDYTITVKSLTDEPIRLDADPHHAGFHFRAAQEVADAKGANGKPGAATYIRSEGAKLKGNDIWENENWAHMMFSVKGKSYAVTHFDPPTNPRPILYSTRPYGRVGSFFVAEVAPDKPLELHYRLRIRDGAPAVAPEELALEYQDYSTPVKLTVSH